jgi:hypothetical protein
MRNETTYKVQRTTGTVVETVVGGLTLTEAYAILDTLPRDGGTVSAIVVEQQTDEEKES